MTTQLWRDSLRLMADLWITALSNHSTTRESILEHRFLADVAAQLWSEGEFGLSISHSEVDNAGYDVIVEARGVTRHIQLKTLHQRGKARYFSIQHRLQDKPSGCIVLIRHDAKSLAVTHYEFVGGLPGEKLSLSGGKTARHTKGDAQGFKTERPALRLLPRSAFTVMPSMAALTERLFGSASLPVGLAAEGE